uniref:Rieske 2Fe-2S domain-containing protein n=1 Tax=Caballeronia sp. LjRoot34 TaxID=3342325 RepID=UPI003F4FA797
MDGENARKHFVKSTSSSDNRWSFVCFCRDIAPETARGYVVKGNRLVVWRDAQGYVHVWNDQCPHRGDPLSSGEVNGCLITCLSHGWRFDVDGQRVRQLSEISTHHKASFIRVYRSKEHAEAIWVWIEPSRVQVTHVTRNP